MARGIQDHDSAAATGKRLSLTDTFDIPSSNINNSTMAPATTVDNTSDLPIKTKDTHASTEDRVKRNELRELTIADQLGAPDVYIDCEKDTLWYHWVGTIYVKILRIENRSGTYVIALKTDPHAELGKHRHRGQVKAYTRAGTWGYHECVLPHTDCTVAVYYDHF